MGRKAGRTNSWLSLWVAGGLKDCGVEQIAKRPAKMLAIVRRLCHENREQGVLRRNPECRSRPAAPEIVADRSWRRRESILQAHAEAEDESVTRRKKRAAAVNIRSKKSALHNTD